MVILRTSSLVVLAFGASSCLGQFYQYRIFLMLWDGPFSLASTVLPSAVFTPLKPNLVNSFVKDLDIPPKFF